MIGARRSLSTFSAASGSLKKLNSAKSVIFPLPENDTLLLQKEPLTLDVMYMTKVVAHPPDIMTVPIVRKI